MCGIIGYAGKQDCTSILIEGLYRLEYRGYDSVGIAGIEDGKLFVQKRKGKVKVLEQLIEQDPKRSTIGIAHTRWATHGEPSIPNAHPFTDCKEEIAIVHNGIIENYNALITLLKKEGHVFKSETDSEVLVHLIEKFYEKDVPLEKAVIMALQQVEGTYGLAVIAQREPRKIVGARLGSPLILAIGKDENLIASDINAVLRFTNQVVHLNDGEVVVITDDSFQILDMESIPIEPEIQKVSDELLSIEKEGYDYFMLKEIFEQPKSMSNSMRGRFIEKEGIPKFGGLKLQIDQLQRAKRIIITACGTSWHAALAAEYMIEELAGIPVEVDYASEFRYRGPIIDRDTLVIVISQSGETADTLAAMREAKNKGATVIGICNAIGSTIARETNGGIYLYAGPEIGVASTKAFTSQIVVLSMLAILLGRMRRLSISQGQELIQCLKEIPAKVEEILHKDIDVIKEIAKEFMNNQNFLYLGRGYNFPVALEGALKLKEISYIHAEGYPAAEMKHGPIALIDENMPVVVIAPQDQIYPKIMSNIEEIKSRKGRIIAIANEGDEFIKTKADRVIYIPKTLPIFTPLLSIIPLQLLAYYIAVNKGLNVDQPRNLAKSVTVE